MLFVNQVTQIGEGIILLNLQKIRGGRAAIIDRIPNVPGVYSWFRSYSLPPASSSPPQVFAQYLIDQAQAKHCLDRKGSLPPLYEVILRSRKQLSGSKQASLVKLCESQQFRENIASMLQVSFLFQQPLYVGKTQDLAERIDEHLQPESVLRTRLVEVGVVLTDCWLLCVLLPTEDDLPAPSPSHDTTDTTIPWEDAVEGEDAGETVLSPELVLEDLISRLFHPLLTERYG